MATMLLMLSTFLLCAVFVKSGMVMLAHVKPKELSAPEQDTFADFACDALVTRVFEQRMVDAGISTVAEMTTCGSPVCKDCLPTRIAIKDAERAKLEPKILNRKPRPLLVGGQEIPWPGHVPTHAAVEVIHPSMLNRGNYYYLVKWLWIDQKSAKQLNYSVKVADLGGFTESVMVYNDQNEKTWTVKGVDHALDAVVVGLVD